MADREDWGLRFLVLGMGLGLSLMFFAVTFSSFGFYQTWIAPTMTGGMKAGGYALDGGILLSFVLMLAGIACFSTAKPSPAPVARAQPAPRRAPARPSRGRPRPAHGST